MWGKKLCYASGESREEGTNKACISDLSNERLCKKKTFFFELGPAEELGKCYLSKFFLLLQSSEGERERARGNSLNMLIPERGALIRMRRRKMIQVPLSFQKSKTLKRGLYIFLFKSRISKLDLGMEESKGGRKKDCLLILRFTNVLFSPRGTK